MNEHGTPDPLDADELRALLGAYVLDAVDADEAAAIEQHLLDDQDARAELHALQLGAAWLHQSAERPSTETWEAIAQAMAQDLAAEAEGTAAPAATPLRTRPSRTARALALAAAFVAVIAVAGGVRVAIDPADVGDAALASAVEDARAQPGARSVTLETADGTGTIEAVVLKDGSGLALPTGVAPLDARRTYQLWAISADGPVSLGTLGADPGAHRFRDAGAATSLAVTEEPRGGSPQPTGRELASGALQPA